MCWSSVETNYRIMSKVKFAWDIFAHDRGHLPDIREARDEWI